MLFRRGKNEDDVCWWFLQCLQESIEGLSRKHVHLVNDKHLVLSCLRRDACLLHQGLDMLHTIVGGCIKLEDVQRAALGKSLAALAFSAGIT